LKKNEQLLAEQRRLIQEIDKSSCLQDDHQNNVVQRGTTSHAKKPVAPMPIGKLDQLNKEAIKRMRPGARGTFAIARPDTKVGKPWATPRKEGQQESEIEKKTATVDRDQRKSSTVVPPTRIASPPTRHITSSPPAEAAPSVAPPPRAAPPSPPKRSTTSPAAQKVVASAPSNRPISQPGKVSTPAFASKKPSSQIQHPPKPAQSLYEKQQKINATKDVKYPLLTSNFTQGGSLRSKM